MQALTHALGGRVAASANREYGPAQVSTILPNPLLRDGLQQVWMSHGDRIEALPPGFRGPGAERPFSGSSDGGSRRGATMACNFTLRYAIHPWWAGNPAPLRSGRLPGAPGLDAQINRRTKASSASAARWAMPLCYLPSAAASIRAWRLPWCSAPSATSWRRSSSIPGCCARMRLQQVQNSFTIIWA